MNATRRKILQAAIEKAKQVAIGLEQLQTYAVGLAEGQREYVNRMSPRMQATPHGKREMDESDALEAARDWIDNAVDALEKAAPFLTEARGG